jgi:hypothetical protein
VGRELLDAAESLEGLANPFTNQSKAGCATRHKVETLVTSETHLVSLKAAKQQQMFQRIIQYRN